MPLKYINSKVDGKPLHIIFWPGANDTGRIPITPEKETLQAAAINLVEGQTFKAHKHLPTIRETMGTQESWIVIRGTVEAILYDLDDTIISREILPAGSLSITLRAGHNYRSLTGNTLVYEFKNGPYMGVVADKVFINEQPSTYNTFYEMGKSGGPAMPEINCLNEKMKLPETNFFYDKALEASKEIKDGLDTELMARLNRRETWGEYDG